MNKPLALVSLITLALLTACSDKAEEKAGSISCNDPAVLQSARDSILQTIKQEARQYAQNDNRQYVDADKVIAAGSDLGITLNEVKSNSNGTSPACTAVLNIQIPEPILQAARDNQALVYYPQNLDGILQQRTGGNTGLSYDNNGLFKQLLNYTPAPAQNAGVTVNYADNKLTNTGQTLTATLLPYGVKSILMMGGKPIPREEALKQLAIAASALSDTPAPSSQPDPHDILENNSASAIFAPETGAGSGSAPETLAPKPETPAANISPAELDQARSNNQQADADINRAWERLEQTVQKELLSEQRDWIHSKNSNCRAAAARAGSTEEAEYLKLQCDTRMTRERIQYLKGYSIP